MGGRGLVSAQPIPVEQGGGLLLVCDCGTMTHLVIHWDNTRPVPEQEIASTCDGCGTAHWLKIGPPS